MNRLERLAQALLLAALAQTVPATAVSHAGEPSAADVATARDLFRKGAKHAQDGEWQQALEAFERSMALRPSSLTRYSLAVAQERVGKLVESMENVRAFLAEPVQPATHPYVKPARDMLAQLESRIARLKVVIPGDPRGAQVRIDGREIPEAAIGIDRVVNPGKHRVEAVIPGYSPFFKEVELAEGGHIEVVVKAADHGEPAGSHAPGAVLTSLTIDESVPETGPSNDTIPIVLIASGGAVFTGGLVLGVIGYGKAQGAETGEGSDADAARSLALAGDVAMGVGLVAAGVGTYLLLSSDQKPKEDTASWTVVPWVMRSSGGVGMQASF